MHTLHSLHFTPNLPYKNFLSNYPLISTHTKNTSASYIILNQMNNYTKVDIKICTFDLSHIAFELLCFTYCCSQSLSCAVCLKYSIHLLFFKCILLLKRKVLRLTRAYVIYCININVLVDVLHQNNNNKRICTYCTDIYMRQLDNYYILAIGYLRKTLYPLSRNTSNVNFTTF